MCTTHCNIKKPCMLHFAYRLSLYVFCMILTISTDYLPKQQQPSGISNDHRLFSVRYEINFFYT